MNAWPTGTPPEDRPIWDLYRGTCIRCMAPAVCLHEDPPRSLDPDWRMHPETRYPTCQPCHDDFQWTPGWDLPILAQGLLTGLGRTKKQIEDAFKESRRLAVLSSQGEQAP